MKDTVRAILRYKRTVSKYEVHESHSLWKRSQLYIYEHTLNSGVIATNTPQSTTDTTQSKTTHSAANICFGSDVMVIKMIFLEIRVIKVD